MLIARKVKETVMCFYRRLQKGVKQAKKNDVFFMVIVIFALYVFLAVLGIGCPIKFLTGISCAGCGMTRGWKALLHLDVQKAFFYHPLFWTPPVIVVLFALKNKINVKIYKACLYIIILAFLIVYLCRIIGDDPVVLFEPEKGIIIKIIKLIF